VVLFFWSLREGLALNLTLLTLVLPFFFTLGVGFFWFLLPSTLLARIPIILVYGVGIYALCLTSNIYTVAAIRTIALLRAARGVGFVISLFTFFLVYDAILSFKGSIVYSSLAIYILSFPLFLHGFWTTTLGKKFDWLIIRSSLITSLVVAEVAVTIFFWPVSVVVGSLFLTVFVYMLLGLGQADLEGRLFSQTIREYLVVGVLVFFGMILATHWGG